MENQKPFSTLLLVFSLLLGLTYPSWSALPYLPKHPDPVLEQWRFHYFPELEGKNARQMTQTEDGVLWFIIDSGLMKYDGYEWSEFGSLEIGFTGPVLSIHGSRDGNLYIGTASGLYRYDKKTWEKLFPIKGEFVFAVNSVIDAKDGSLWAGTIYGALHIEKSKITLYTLEEISRLLTKRNIDIPISVIPIDNNNFTLENNPEFNFKNRLDGIFSYIGLYSYYLAGIFDPEGICDNSGLKEGDVILSAKKKEKDGKSFIALDVHRISIPTEIEIPEPTSSIQYRDFNVVEIMESQNHGIWFGFTNGALLQFTNDAKWKYHTKADGLDQWNSPRLFQTHDGNIWTINNDTLSSINVFNGNQWKSIPNSQGTHFSIIETDDHTLWMGGMGELLCLRDNRVLSYTPNNDSIPIPSSRLQLYKSKDGTVWILGIGQSVVRFDCTDKRWSTYSDLLFQDETKDSKQWFIHKDGSIICNTGQDWLQYSVEDGLMNTPDRVFVTQNNTILAAGCHDRIAAAAVFNGTEWIRKLLPEFSNNIDHRAIAETPDGDIWFGSPGESYPGTGGYLQYKPSNISKLEGNWNHFSPPLFRDFCYGIGAAGKDSIWFISLYGMYHYDGKNWSQPSIYTLRAQPLDSMLIDDQKDVWAGSRSHGVYHYSKNQWTNYTVQNGLPSNRIFRFMQDHHKYIWIETDKGVAVYDGVSWNRSSIPPFNLKQTPYYPVKQTSNGAFWMNSVDSRWFERTMPAYVSKNVSYNKTSAIRYNPDTSPPLTKINVPLKQIPYPGYLEIHWSGEDYLRDTDNANLEFSFRLDQNTWSPFSKKIDMIYQSMPSGMHTFEVLSRDQNYNVEHKPFLIQFEVLPPLWKQLWFVLLLIILSSLILLQTLRVFRRDRRLRNMNKSLESRVHERTLELLKSKEDLDKSEKLYRKAISVADAVPYYLNYEIDEFEFIGEGIFDITGYHAIEFSRDAFSKIILEMDLLGDTKALSIHDAIQKARKDDGFQWKADYLIKTKDRKQRWLTNAAVQVHDDQGKIIGSLGIFQDITERRNLENQLRQSQKMESIGKLAGGIAHDFNNLLTIILGYSEMILDGLPKDHPLYYDLNQIQHAGERAATLTRQLLAFSRKQILKPKILNMNQLLDNMYDMIKRLIGEDIEYITITAPAVGKIKADPGQIEQVILNLAVNSRDAMPKGGRLTIETKNASLDKADLDEYSDVVSGHYVMLSVSDTGSGIPNDVKDKIFEPFFTTKEIGKGTGLGLSTVYGIVKQSDGYIFLDSEVGKGTAFRLYFPRIDENLTPSMDTLPEAMQLYGNESILVVEDEELVLNLVCNTLQKYNYHVIRPKDGLDAIQLAEQKTFQIDLLITDVVMPNLSGREVADRIAVLYPGIKILYMSGYTDEAIVHHGLLEGGIHFIHKPFKPLDLLKKTREILDK